MSLSLLEVKDICMQEIKHEGANWYRGFRRKHKYLCRFRDVESLIAFLNDTRTQSEEELTLKDSILCALIPEFQANPRTSLLRSVFIVTFYPVLSDLLRPFYNKNLEHDDLLGEAICALLKVVATFDISLYKKTLAAFIAKRTRRQFWFWTNQELHYLNNFTEIDEQLTAESPVIEQDIPTPDDALRFFKLMRNRGIISALEEYLMVGTRVYGQQLKEIVAEQSGKLNGLGYEAAKKRVQRAENKIKNHLKNSELYLSEQKK